MNSKTVGKCIPLSKFFLFFFFFFCSYNFWANLTVNFAYFARKLSFIVWLYIIKYRQQNQTVYGEKRERERHEWSILRTATATNHYNNIVATFAASMTAGWAQSLLLYTAESRIKIDYARIHELCVKFIYGIYASRCLVDFFLGY